MDKHLKAFFQAAVGVPVALVVLSQIPEHWWSPRKVQEQCEALQMPDDQFDRCIKDRGFRSDAQERQREKGKWERYRRTAQSYLTSHRVSKSPFSAPQDVNEYERLNDATDFPSDLDYFFYDKPKYTGPNKIVVRSAFYFEWSDEKPDSPIDGRGSISLIPPTFVGIDSRKISTNMLSRQQIEWLWNNCRIICAGEVFSSVIETRRLDFETHFALDKQLSGIMLFPLTREDLVKLMDENFMVGARLENPSAFLNK